MRCAGTNGPKVAAAIAVLVVLFSSCLKTEEFPVEPIIAFKSFEQLGDSASYTFSFTDGDGDIGLSLGDTNPPFDALPYAFNYYLDVYLWVNEGWVLQDFVTPLRGIIPVITPTGQDKTLEGEISVAIASFSSNGSGPPWYTVLGFEAGDSLRIDARIYDRALHVSNTTPSGPITLE